MVKWRWCGGPVDGGDGGGDGEGLACEGLAAATAATCFAIVKVLPLSQLDLQATHPGDGSTTRVVRTPARVQKGGGWLGAAG